MQRSSVPNRRPRALAVTVGVAVSAGTLLLLLAGLVVGGGAPQATLDGLPDAGPWTGWGVPTTGAVTRLAAIATVGTLLFAAVLAPGRAPRLEDAGLRALRASSWWTALWAASTAAGGVLAVSAAAGVPVHEVTPDLLVAFAQTVPGRLAPTTAVVLAAAAVAAHRATTRSTARLLLVISLLNVAQPAILVSHSAGADDHALAVTGLALHVLGASVWVGGLGALLVHGRSRDVLPRAARRYSTIALACFAVVTGSGVLSAWVLLAGTPLAETLGSGYGLLLLAKTAAVVVLGGFGWWHRRRTLVRLAGGRPRSFLRFAVVEVAVMVATVAVAVALSASPPPAAPAAGPPAATGDGRTAPSGGAGTAPAIEDMSGHDHGELSVGVLVDESRYHVSSTVSPGQAVTVYNASTTAVTITADDGSFDAAVPGQTFITFTAPAAPGTYAFSSRHSAVFTDVLVVRP